MSGFTIRTATLKDIPGIIAAQEQTWWVTYEHIIGKEQCDDMFERLYSEPSLAQQIEVLGHRFFLLEKDGKICGFASYASSGKEGIFKLHKIYVTPDTQGTGAGKYLLSSVEEQVKLQGGIELRLNVNRYNPARTFYEKMGYAVLYEEDIPIGGYWMNDYVMGKKF